MDTSLPESKNFKLTIVSGVGMANTPWTKLEVKSKNLANKHVVEISLCSDFPAFDGTPIQYRYFPEKTYVKHGMRMEKDTLDETLEYAEVLKEAVAFAKTIKAWLNEHSKWKFNG